MLEQGRTAGAAAALALALLLHASPALAAENRVFLVSRVAVDVTAESAAVARAQALAQGQTKAVELLLERLTLREHRARIGAIDAAKLSTLVQGFEVGSERASATRYIGEINFRFRPDAFRKLLRDAAVPYSDTEARAVLIVPVLEQTGADGVAQRLLWEEANPWRAAWARVAGGGAIVPLVLPAGDLTDSAALDAEAAIAGDGEKLKLLAQRYGLSDTLVAHARVEPSRDQTVLAIKLKRNGQAMAPLKLSPNADAAQEPFADAVKGVVRLLEEQWKRQTLISFDTMSEMNVTVPLAGLADWVEVRERLAKAGEVNRVDLLAVDRGAARLHLRYFGTPERLKLGLAQRNLALNEEGGGWRLSRSDAAPQGNAPPGAPLPTAPRANP